MVTTLANGVLRPVLVFPLGVLMFLGAVRLAFPLSGCGWYTDLPGRWRAVMWWGFFYPVFQCAQSTMLVINRDTAWAHIIPPSVVTAALLLWATRSWIPIAGCAAGCMATALLVDLSNWRADWVILRAVPWNVAVGTSLMVWAWNARRTIMPEGHCASCGYDVRGSAGRICPECGRVKT